MLTKERIEEIRHLATVQKVDGMLVQEHEVVALCDAALALRSERAQTIYAGPELSEAELMNLKPGPITVVPSVNEQLRSALKDLLEQVESLDSYGLTCDTETYKAQANWDDAINNAAAALNRAPAWQPVSESPKSGEGWIPCDSRLPEAKYGHEGEPPYVSEDVLIRYSDGLVEMANFDHEERLWTVVTTLRHAFEPPECWMEVPPYERGWK